MKPLTALLIFFFLTYALKAQDEEYDPDYTPFGIFVDDILAASGTPRLDEINKAFEALEAGSTEFDPFTMPDIYFFKVRQLCGLKQFDEALVTALELRDKAYSFSVEMTSTGPRAYALSYVAEGYVHWLQRDKETAKIFFDSARMEHNGFYPNYYLGWIAQSNDENEAALNYYETAAKGITLDKLDKSEAFYKSALIYHGMNLYTKAIDYYTKAFETYPMCKSIFDRARLYYYSSAYPDKTIAYDDFRKVIDNCDESFDRLGKAYSYVAEDHYNKQEDDIAGQYYQKAYELSGGYTDAVMVGIVAYVKKDWNGTIRWCTEGINASRNFNDVSQRTLGDAYFYRGYAYWNQQKMDNVVSDLKMARSLGHKQAAEYLKQYFNQ